MLLVGISSAGGSPASAVSAAPATVGLRAALPAFYDVPSPLPPGQPGQIIKSEVVSAPDVHGTVTRVMYHSTNIDGGDIAVTGLIVVPNGPAPAGGRRVVAWAHGTTGIADECAPSLNPGSADLANLILDQGWIFAATDFEGMGTPGRHPYIVGDSEAHGVLDSVRAARDLGGASVSSDYVVWGHSQGGHAAMFALHLADSYAPDLHLKGVVAGAPPSQFYAIYQALVGSPFKYYLLMAAAGINAAYGDVRAPLDQILTPAGLTLVNEVDNGCTGYLGTLAQSVDIAAIMKTQADGTQNPFSNPIWQALMKAQDPGNFTTAAPEPLLIIHGGNDEQIPTVSSQLLLGQLCAIGQETERWMYPGRSHAGVIAPSSGDMLHWISDRFDGLPAPSAWAPSGQADIAVSGCEQQPVPPTTPPTTPGGPGTAQAATPVRTTPTYTG